MKNFVLFLVLLVAGAYKVTGQDSCSQNSVCDKFLIDAEKAPLPQYCSASNLFLDCYASLLTSPVCAASYVAKSQLTEALIHQIIIPHTSELRCVLENANNPVYAPDSCRFNTSICFSLLNPEFPCESFSTLESCIDDTLSSCTNVIRDIERAKDSLAPYTDAPLWCQIKNTKLRQCLTTINDAISSSTRNGVCGAFEAAVADGGCLNQAIAQATSPENAAEILVQFNEVTTNEFGLFKYPLYCDFESSCHGIFDDCNNTQSVAVRDQCSLIPVYDECLQTTIADQNCDGNEEVLLTTNYVNGLKLEACPPTTTTTTTTTTSPTTTTTTPTTTTTTPTTTTTTPTTTTTTPTTTTTTPTTTTTTPTTTTSTPTTTTSTTTTTTTPPPTTTTTTPTTTTTTPTTTTTTPTTTTTTPTTTTTTPTTTTTTPTTTTTTPPPPPPPTTPTPTTTTTTPMTMTTLTTARTTTTGPNTCQWTDQAGKRGRESQGTRVTSFLVETLEECKAECQKNPLCQATSYKTYFCFTFTTTEPTLFDDEDYTFSSCTRGSTTPTTTTTMEPVTKTMNTQSVYGSTTTTVTTSSRSEGDCFVATTVTEMKTCPVKIAPQP